MNETYNTTPEKLLYAQKQFFLSGQTKEVGFRIQMLKKLRDAIEHHEDSLLEALHQDLGKSRTEGYMTELAMVKGEIKDALAHVKKWSRKRRVHGTIGTFPSASYIYPEPYGVVFIAAPWNYPVNLSLSPLVSAIAAGNCAILKCSRSSSHTSLAIARLIAEIFAPDYVSCADPTADYDDVLKQDYDYIFFTGSPRIGKKIMAAASDRLIPVTLELGGKSPCIIDESADLALAARRILWGKLLNAGQTCISIDYVCVHASVAQAFAESLRRELHRTWPDALHDDTYPRIITKKHFDRLCRLLERQLAVTNLTIGGQSDEKSRKIEPTVILGCDFDHPVMEEEIFGPILPVIAYDDMDALVGRLQTMEKPLACYIFTRNHAQADRLLRDLSFGGGCINDTIMHISNPHMPFGGVGNSGMGGYHGWYGFETFSHKKSIVKSPLWIDVPFRYRPFNDRKLSLLKKLM